MIMILLARIEFLRKITSKQLLGFAFGILSCAWLGHLFNESFGIMLDVSEIRCLPETVYVGYPSDGAIQKGDLVSFVATPANMAGLFVGSRIIKQVAAVPGDLVETQEDGLVLINGRPSGRRNEITLQKMQKRGAQLVSFSGVVPAGHYFVMGTLPRSFDSRYWGLLEGRLIDKKAWGVV